MADNGVSPIKGWGAFAATLIAGALGLFSVLEQAQISFLKDDIAGLRSESKFRDDEIRQEFTEFVRRMHQLPDIFLGVREHAEFEKRLDADLADIKAQIVLLERTRPTTGELQGASDALKDRIGTLERIIGKQPSDGK